MIQTMDKELYKYWEKLDTNQKKSIIGMIKSFLQPADKKNRTTVAQYNKEIDAAMNRIDEGDFVSHGDVLKEMAKLWKRAFLNLNKFLL